MNARHLIVWLFVLITTCHGDFIYDVDFESPPHTVDAPVVVGPGSDTPSVADPSVFVRDSLGDFTTQVASLEPAGSMGFGSSTTFSSDIVTMSWDMAILSLGPTGPETAAISIGGSGPGSVILFFMQDLSIEVDGMNAASFSLGQQDHYEFVFDLDADSYDFTFNGTPAVTDQAVHPDFNVNGINFSRDFLASPDYAVDNFQWTVIPEPSTVLLLLLGGLGLAVRRFYAGS